jgi:hypothetical protein
LRKKINNCFHLLLLTTGLRTAITFFFWFNNKQAFCWAKGLPLKKNGWNWKGQSKVQTGAIGRFTPLRTGEFIEKSRWLGFLLLLEIFETAHSLQFVPIFHVVLFKNSVFDCRDRALFNIQFFRYFGG